jgi:hypothetical protein
MTAFGESCRRCGHVLAARFDPKRRSPANFCCVAKLLFDHLVGSGQQRLWNGKAKGLGSREVNHQFELGRLQNRQIRRLLALRILPV